MTFLKDFDKVKNIRGQESPHGKIDKVHRTAKKQRRAFIAIVFFAKKERNARFSAKRGVNGGRSVKTYTQPTKK